MKEQLTDRSEFFTSNDINKQDDGNYAGKILVIRESRVMEYLGQYRNPQNQLFVASSGFGCSPTALGSAVYGRFIIDGIEGETCRLERYHFLGVLKNEVAHELGYCSCGSELEKCTKGCAK